MAALSAYNALPVAGATYATTSQISEIFLKSYTVGSGVTGITISDALFNLATYKTIHVRFNNVTTSGATTTYLGGGPLKNGALISGTYYGTFEGVSSSTATGWGVGSYTPATIVSLVNLQLTPNSLTFAGSIPQIDIYINKNGMQFEMHYYDLSNSRRLSATVSYATTPQTFTAADFTGMFLGVASGTFTGGTVSVFGVQ